MAPNNEGTPVDTGEAFQPQTNVSRENWQMPTLSKETLSKAGAVLLGILAAGEARGGEFAIIETNTGTSSPDLVQADLDGETNTTIDGSRTSMYEGATDCKFIPTANKVVCSTGRASAVDQGLMIIETPTDTPSVSYETPSDYEWAWKINYDASGDVISWTSTDGASTNKMWWADATSGLSTSEASSCDVTGNSPIAVAVDTTDATEPYAVVANNGDGTLEIIRLSDCTSMYVEYTVPSHATPGLTYPYDIALDTDNDRAYLVSDTSVTIVEIDTSDLATPIDQAAVSTTGSPYDILLLENPTTGSNELWIATWDASYDYVEVFDAGDASSTAISSTITSSGYFTAFAEYSPLAVSENADLVYVSTGSSVTIHAIDTSTYALSTTAGPYSVGTSTGPLAIAWPVTATPTEYTYYTDADLDGYGDISSPTTSTDTTPPTGTTTEALATDCDDTDSATFPGAAASDSATDCMTDADGDGFGDSSATGDVIAGNDCDDTDASAYPGATETCDGDLEDCDLPSADYGATTTYYLDEDGDTYGTSDSTEACGPDGAYTATVEGDCDDTNNSAYPGAPEPDCVTTASEAEDLNCDTTEPEVCEDDEDLDGDGELSLEQGGTDCDDDDPDVNSAATEVCDDGIDNDCDTLTDLLDTEDCETTGVTDDGDCLLEEDEIVTITTPDPRCTTLFLDNETSGNSIANPVGTFAWVDYARVSIESLAASGIVVRDDAVSEATIEVLVNERGEALGIGACEIGFEKNSEGWTAWTLDLNDAAEHWFDLQLPTLNGGEWIERAAMEGEKVVVEADGTLNEAETTGEGACAVEGVECEAVDTGDTGDSGEQPDDTGTPNNPNNPDTDRPEQPDDGCNGCATAGGIEGASGYFGTQMALLLALGAGLLRRRKE